MSKRRRKRFTHANRILSTIGFCGFPDLVQSTFRPDISGILFGISLISTALANYTGITEQLMYGFFLIFSMELLTGLFAAKLKKRAITSRRAQRFGIMVAVWFSILFLFDGLIENYKDRPQAVVYEYMHSLLVFYIVGVYITSISENLEEIWKNKINAKLLIKQLFTFKKDGFK